MNKKVKYFHYDFFSIFMQLKYSKSLIDLKIIQIQSVLMFSSLFLMMHVLTALFPLTHVLHYVKKCIYLFITFKKKLIVLFELNRGKNGSYVLIFSEKTTQLSHICLLFFCATNVVSSDSWHAFQSVLVKTDVGHVSCV